jgi:four helix bundle suffix protein
LPHSGYRKLIAYRKSEVIYQGTVAFCRRFLPAHGDRTVDQMTQAARSCKQNIAEGSAAAAVSLETQLKLTGVAKASLNELLEDVHDWLTAHGEAEWAVDDARTASVRAFAREHESWGDWRGVFESRSGGTLGNVLAVLIHQCRHLLERMMERQEADFARHGGVRERMRTVRDGARGQEWEPALFSWLNGAEDAAALAARAKEAQDAVRHMAAGIRRRRGWPKGSS